jgi:heme/copper-type cytochrome/quinol oxidase subunit 2
MTKPFRALTSLLIAAVMAMLQPATATEPDKGAAPMARALEQASKEAFELLQRQAAQPRADWLVTATAVETGWEFKIISTRKALALANPREPAPASLPPLDALVLPHLASVEVNLTSNTDIHAFVVPGLNIDRTATPGRLERVTVSTANLGVFASKCSDPCTPQAKAMTFSIHIVDRLTFLQWMAAKEATTKPTQQ